MNPEQANDLMQRYAASKPGLGRSQLAERIVDEVMPKLVEALESELVALNASERLIADRLATEALALVRKP